MKITKFFLVIFVITFLSACSKNLEKESLIKENNLESQVYEAYEEGMRSLNTGDVLFAAKKFNEAEILFPQSLMAPKSALMAAYSYYSGAYYKDAIAELERFIKVYPSHKNIDYAYYLMAVSFYELIVDEKKDTQSIFSAKKFFTIVKNKYPNTEYAIDADFKLDLIDDIIASKEMYIARYYFERKKWIPAINRFRTVVDKYDTTIYVEEALHRLVESYYTLGLIDEAQKYANLLGYNYKSSIWYEKSYSVFNKNYKKQKRKITENKSNQNTILNKIKSIIDLDG